MTGVVVQMGESPTMLGEYWHIVKTEFGEREKPGCNLELAPTPKTNQEALWLMTRIHIEYMENSALINSSPGVSIAQTFEIDSQEFRSLVNNVRELIAVSNLSDAQRSEADAGCATLEVELKSSNPNKGVVRATLQSVRTILENAAGNLIGSAAYAALVQYILHIKP